MTRITLGITVFARIGMACVAVSGDKILVREFSQSMAEFAGADQAQIAGFAPLPGTQRTFTTRQVRDLARRAGVEIKADRLKDLCFVREVHELTKADFQAALVVATKGSASMIEVLDYSRGALPSGQLELPLKQVVVPPTPAAETPVLWRGRLVSSSGHSYPTWVKARIVTETEVMFAKVTLVKGGIIAPDQVELRAVKQFPFIQGQLNSRSDVVGKIVRHEIASGQMITPSAVEEPKEISTGDTVRVASVSGKAEIYFDARARTGGKKGDTILIQNPVNGRSFRALVTGKGQVVARPVVKDFGVKL